MNCVILAHASARLVYITGSCMRGKERGVARCLWKHNTKGAYLQRIHQASVGLSPLDLPALGLPEGPYALPSSAAQRAMLPLRWLILDQFVIDAVGVKWRQAPRLGSTYLHCNSISFPVRWFSVSMQEISTRTLKFPAGSISTAHVQTEKKTRFLAPICKRKIHFKPSPTLLPTKMPRNGMSEYELDRLERIKENEKMLNELFPKGTSLKQPKTVKRRRQTDTNSLGTGSGTSGSGSEEENSELGTSKPKRTFQQM